MLDTVNSSKQLDDLAEFLTLKMREMFHRDGQIFVSLLGYTDNLELALTITQGEETDPAEQLVSPDADLAVYVLPAPLRNHSEGIAKLAAAANVTVFAMMSENWTYPEGPEGIAAAEAYMRGEGPPPSEHPNRSELVSAFITSPKWGYCRFIGWEIRRKNRSAPRLRPKFDSGLDAGSDNLMEASSWLDECLPYS